MQASHLQLPMTSDKFVNMEAIATVAKSEVISLTFQADFDTDTGIKTVNLSGDTNATGTNVVNASNTDGDFTITGSAGVDQITGGGGADVVVTGAGDDVVTGGAGNDNITVGDGDNDIIFGAKGTANGDTIASFTSTEDQLNLAATMTIKRGADNQNACQYRGWW